jgi:hypothetical protein
VPSQIPAALASVTHVKQTQQPAPGFRRYVDPWRAFTVMYHQDVTQADMYRVEFGKLRVRMYGLPGESAPAMWVRVLLQLSELQSECVRKRFVLWQIGLPGPLMPHAIIYAKEHAVQRKLRERLAFAEARARTVIRGDKPTEPIDAVSLLRMLIEIGERHPDGMTRVRALSKAADLLGMGAPTSECAPSDQGVMLVPAYADMAEWGRVAEEAQEALRQLTRDGPTLARS